MTYFPGTLINLEEAPADWEPITPFPMGSVSFVSGHPHGNRLRVRYYKRKGDENLVGKVWFGPEAEGPPGHAHGGSMAAVLDEVMGACAWMKGHTVLAAQLTTNFRNPLPLGTIAHFEATVDRVEGRKVYTTGRLADESGKLFCEGTCLFIVIDPTKFSQRKQD